MAMTFGVTTRVSVEFSKVLSICDDLEDFDQRTWNCDIYYLLNTLIPKALYKSWK